MADARMGATPDLSQSIEDEIGKVWTSIGKKEAWENGWLDSEMVTWNPETQGWFNIVVTGEDA